MNAGQYAGIMGALDKILDRMPVPEPQTLQQRKDYPTSPCPVPGHGWKWIPGDGVWDCSDCRFDPPKAPVITGPPRTNTNVQADKRQALAILRAVLDDWIKGARENHVALGHRNENRGEECWRTFHASDIRVMINDAARELGLEQFVAPEEPEEEKKCE